jgi:excisionase family DNA binding protein
MAKLTATVEETAWLLGVSRMTAYAAVRAGVIPSIRIGRRLLVPRVALDRMLSGAAEGGIRASDTQTDAS